MKSLMFITIVLSAFGLHASFEKDREQILGMAGCYSVRFQFAETFPRQAGYKIQAPHFSGGLEWVEVDVDQPGKIELQHLLIVAPKVVIKHWRQEWSYEDSERFAFKGDKRWVKESYSDKQISGAWEQNVLQVDDSPRYECQNQWSHTNTQSLWECTSWNPLPRREFSKRDDYNVLNRRNRHQLTSYGWVHEQDNEKVVAKEGVLQKVLTDEKGKNTYTKVDDNKCLDAQNWWKSRRDIWATVRQAWDQIHSEKDVMAFKKMDEPLWSELNTLSETALSTSSSSAVVKAQALEIIRKHLK